MNTEMTDEIAFKLGKFDFPHFYSMVCGVEDELIHFFNWSIHIIPSGRFGMLNGNLFTEITHKLNFIRGRLTSYSVLVEENKIRVDWANSYDLRDLFADFSLEVLRDKFELEPPDESGGRRYKKNTPKFSITKTEIVGTIPGTPSVVIEADKEVIKYLTGNL